MKNFKERARERAEEKAATRGRPTLLLRVGHILPSPIQLIDLCRAVASLRGSLYANAHLLRCQMREAWLNHTLSTKFKSSASKRNGAKDLALFVQGEARRWRLFTNCEGKPRNA
jgi:hypothetical protein